MEFPRTLHKWQGHSCSVAQWTPLAFAVPARTHAGLHSLGNEWVVFSPVSIFLRYLVMPTTASSFGNHEVWALLQTLALGQGYFGSCVIPAGNWEEEGIRSFPSGFVATHTHLVTGECFILRTLAFDKLTLIQFDLAECDVFWAPVFALDTIWTAVLENENV